LYVPCHRRTRQGRAPRGGRRAQALGHVQAEVEARATVVQRQKGAALGTPKQIDSTKNQRLIQDRFLFVKRRLKPSERKRFLYITREFPQLRKLREIMEHLYALFDRRCRTQTALGKLKKLRQWVKRFKWIGDTLNKVFSPNLEKALTFLDDKLLPATSNAVERGNRRHRKMQKSVYRVRSKVCLEGRIALDMIRESRAESRDQTTAALHKARRGYT
jgi:hypothetical protein